MSTKYYHICSLYSWTFVNIFKQELLLEMMHLHKEKIAYEMVTFITGFSYLIT